MALQLGDEAPDFTAETTEGTVQFHEWLGDGWGVLFSHPKDFTPVCTTELGRSGEAQGRVRQAQRQGHRRERRPHRVAQGLGDRHQRDPGHARSNFPIIADPDRKVADLYGMIHPNASDTVTVRSVFVIGPDKKVKLMITYPQSTGRNFAEILRVLDSLQLTARLQRLHPGGLEGRGGRDHRPGTVSDDAAKEKFPKGWTAPRPYLRLTPQPNK